MSSPLNITRYDKALRRALGLVGRGAIVTTLLEDIFPVIDVENLPLPLRILGGDRAAFGSVFQAATAAQIAAVSLLNPADSGKLVHVTGVSFSTDDAAVNIQPRASSAIPARGGSKAYRDLRDAGTTTAELGINANHPGAAATVFIRPAVVNTTCFLSIDRTGFMVLPPGFAVELICQNVNFAIRGNFEWFERDAEESELQL